MVVVRKMNCSTIIKNPDNIFRVNMKFLIASIWLILSSISYSQFGVETKYQPNEISPSIFGHVLQLSQRMSLSWPQSNAFQWNILSTTIVINDPYNANKPSGSMYGLYSLGSIAGILLLTQSGGSEGCTFPQILLPDSSCIKPILKYIGYACVAPLILSNSQYYFNISGFDTLLLKPTGLSFFLGTQTDYFDKRDVSWLRFAVRSGLELVVRNDTSTKKSIDRSGFCLQIGITKHWDFLANSKKSGEYFGFVGAKINIF